MTESKNILIIRTDRIGDVILSIPMANYIKSKYPNSKITFLVRNYTAPLLQNHPNIDKVNILKEKNGKMFFFENLKDIKKENYDSVITVYPKFQLALLIFLAGIKNRIGTGYRWYSFLFNRKIFIRRKSGNGHELEYNVMMLEQIGINILPDRKSVDFNIQTDKKSEQTVNELLIAKKVDFSKKTIIIHPGSGGSAIDLPIKKQKQLADLLVQHLNCNIIVTGSNSEKEICCKVAENEKILNLAGKLSLSELMALISKSVLLIANSTGPIHIAAALGISVIGFYPKIHSASPQRWGPYTDKATIFQPKLKCSNCSRKQCEQLNCMNSIEAEEVFAKVKEIVT